MTRRKKYYHKIVGVPLPINLEEQRNLRDEALKFLGNKCSNPNCLVPNGCSDKRCLQIDHIQGVCHQDEPRLVGIALYLDILESADSKERYQLLCANCNWIKRSENNENRGAEQQTKPLYPKSPHISLESKHHLR